MTRVFANIAAFEAMKRRDLLEPIGLVSTGNLATSVAVFLDKSKNDPEIWVVTLA